KEYSRSGYATLTGWIQIITSKRYATLEDTTPSIVTEIDNCETMTRLGNPFFATGYPAEIYDAPCYNLRDDAKLEWVADTFFVTYPSRMNDNAITFLAGFSWGYEESDINGEKKVKILPFHIHDKSKWQTHLSMLQNQFPNWTFQ
ncbi:MAG: hypothetical protein LRY71_15335, partial [Bacillaceae bacterium]|nr:hypothetical protein [Bacillaceae bacterium]